jgi:hypothetical protein
MTNYTRVAMLAGAIALAPASAMAVSLSSNDGVGRQHWTAHGDQWFVSTGKLRSTSGANVYLRGVIVYNSYPDYTCGRLTENTNLAYLVTRGGSCQQDLPIPPTADAAAWKICHDVAVFPDGCGSQHKQPF